MFGIFLEVAVLIGISLIGTTLGEVCVYDEEHQVGVMFDLIGNPAETTIGCICPPTKKLRCDENQQAEFDKLQQYVPNHLSGYTECCVDGPSKNVKAGSDAKKSVEKFKSKAKYDSKRFKLHCTKESLPGRWEDDLIRGFTVFDIQENQEWKCTCHHFRFDDFWLCHDESCGPECQSEAYETLRPITEGCCNPY